jgi:transcriptional regulator with XRE-family HTH domain
MGAARLKVKRGAMPRIRPPRDEGFARRLREVMERERIRPRDLAKGEKVNPVTVSRWRSGEVPDELRLPGLAKRLQTSPEYLKTGQGAPFVERTTQPAPERPASPSEAARPERAADKATLEVFEEGQAKLLGRGLIPAEEAIGWLYRMLKAREATRPTGGEGSSAPEDR